MEKKDSARYQLQVSADEIQIPFKPYVVNTFGDVIRGLLSSLSGVGDTHHAIFLQLNPKADEDHRVVFELAGDEIVIKPFVQVMIQNTIHGFLSSLKGIPEHLENLAITIELSPL